jgi:hypothetical protein
MVRIPRIAQWRDQMKTYEDGTPDVTLFNGLLYLDVALYDKVMSRLYRKSSNLLHAVEIMDQDGRDGMGYMLMCMKFRRLGLRIVESWREYDDKGPSSENHFIIKAEKMTAELFYGSGARLDRGVIRACHEVGVIQPEQYCRHSYDCCGHWYSGRAHIEYIDRDTFHVRQSSHQNV